MKKQNAVSFLILVAIILKVVGFWLVFKAPLPNRFPPETKITQLGYSFYNITKKCSFFLNNNIKIFPSKLVPLIKKNSTKKFFLKTPFLLFDFLIFSLIIFQFLHQKKRKNFCLFSIVILVCLNGWLFFYFFSQRLSLIGEIKRYFLKPFKLSLTERNILNVYFMLLIFSFLSLTINKYLLLISSVLSHFIKNIRKFIFPFATLLFLYLLIYLGFFLKLSFPEQVNWKGYWIWSSDNQETEDLYLIFEKDFNLLFKPLVANLYLVCQSNYRLYLNNSYVGQGGLITGRDYVYYDQWEVASFLRPGKNNIRIECNNPYVNSLTMIQKKGALIMQLETGSGLLKKEVVSDSSFRVTVDKRYLHNPTKVSNYLGYQQIFNGNILDFNWKKAEIIEEAKEPVLGKLSFRPIPVLQENEIKPTGIIQHGIFSENAKIKSENIALMIDKGLKTTSRKNVFNNYPLEIDQENSYLVIDFGKIVVGYPKIELESSGGIVDVGFGEILGTDGIPAVTKMVFQADRVIFKEGKFSYQWFQRRAFRYAILIFSKQKSPVKIINFSLVSENYPSIDNESYFSSSDILLNRIYQISKYTAKIARQGIIEDCPQRERGQYVGDVRIVSLVNYYNYSDKLLAKKALWDFALSQNVDGFINAVAPAGKELFIPDYSVQWISAVWEYYLHTKDIDFVKKIYPFLKKQLIGLGNYADIDGLIKSQPKWWVFIDQGGRVNNNGKSIALNLWYMEALNNFGKLSKEIGETEENKVYGELSEKVKFSIQKKAWRGKENLFDDCLTEIPCDHFSRQTNYLALRSDVVSDVQIKNMVSRLLSDRSLSTIITPYFNFWTAEALYRNSFRKEATNIIRNYWGGMVKQGATTFWETYDPMLGREIAEYGESLSHGWSSGPAYLLPRWVLGIEPLEPGFRTFRIRPLIGELKFAEGRIPVNETNFIEERWEADKGVTLNLKYDFEAKARIELPKRTEKEIKVNGMIANNVVEENGYTIILIEKPGNYEITLQ